MTTPERPTIGFVTSSVEKVLAVKNSLPDYKVVQVPPLFNESILGRTVPQNQFRSRLISQEKARHDLREAMALTIDALGILDWWRAHGMEAESASNGKHFAFYNDCIHYLPEQDYVLEKPRDEAEWLDQVMQQSGRELWISVGHTAVRLDGKFSLSTVGLVTWVHTRAYKRPEIEEFAKRVGMEKLLNTAGGLPVAAGADFFRHDLPYKVFYFPDMQGEGHLAGAGPNWSNLTESDLVRFNTGALPGPLLHLLKESDELR